MSKSLTVITTGAPWNQSRYISLALMRIWREIGPVEVVELGSKLPNTDYFFLTDAGCTHGIDWPLNKTFFWAIDSHLRTYRDSWFLDIGKNCLAVFDSTGGDGIKFFAENNIVAHNLPLGYPLDYMWYENPTKKYGVLWCGGRRFDGLRGQILNIVRNNFQLIEFDSNSHQPIYNDGLRHFINKSKVFLEIPPIEQNYFGARWWEGIGCRANMVSMWRPIVSDFTHPHYFYKENLEVSLINAIKTAIDYPRIILGDIDKFSYDGRLKEYFLPVIQKYL